jgi:hypothetical protein
VRVTLEGVVIDAANRAPVPGAVVLIPAENLATLADGLGAFRLADVPTGSRTLLVRRYGYLDRTISLTVTGDPAPIEVSLSPDPALLDSLGVIVARDVALDGMVVDETSRRPLAGAMVLLRQAGRARDRGVLSDDAGAFELSGVPIGDHLILVSQFGYESLYVSVQATGSQPPLVVPLRPGPLMLEGLTAEAIRSNVETMNRRIENRGRATATASVRTFDQDRLLRSGAADLVDFFVREGRLPPTACVGGGGSTGCVVSRGRIVQPIVCIDEMRTIGALDHVGTFRPEELHLVEVYTQRGGAVVIRAYTRTFMERAARRPRALIPHDLPGGPC